jgi:two-component system chemotaxis response regulator CheB
VDDALLFRHVISQAVGNIPGMEVVGTAASGRLALSQIESLRPDVVTLDIEMPDLDGLGVLKEMKSRGLRAGVVVLSALTAQGGMMTMRALELGAFDFVTKPAGASQIENTVALRDRLEPILRAFAGRKALGVPAGKAVARAPAPAAPARIPPPGSRPAPVRRPGTPSPVRALPPKGQGETPRRSQRLLRSRRLEMVLIGVSTGGPTALTQVLPNLPASLGVPVLVVQHMPPVFTRSLADSLRSRCAMEIKEAEPNEPARPNCIYIAPGGQHMKVVSRACAPVIEVNDEPPENNCRPSVDHLFRSASENFGGRVIAAVLTGMGNDGTAGMKLLRAQGAATIAQDEATCVVFGMPREAIAAGVIDYVLPLDEIAETITDILQGAGS